MSRDIKRNPYQLTKAQLRKKFEIFHHRYEGTCYDPIFKPCNQRLYEELIRKDDQESDEDDENDEDEEEGEE